MRRRKDRLRRLRRSRKGPLSTLQRVTAGARENILQCVQRDWLGGVNIAGVVFLVRPSSGKKPGEERKGRGKGETLDNRIMAAG
jgi:hypothetical protein